MPLKGRTDIYSLRLQTKDFPSLTSRLGRNSDGSLPLSAQNGNLHGASADSNANASTRASARLSHISSIKNQGLVPSPMATPTSSSRVGGGDVGGDNAGEGGGSTRDEIVFDDDELAELREREMAEIAQEEREREEREAAAAASLIRSEEEKKRRRELMEKVLSDKRKARKAFEGNGRDGDLAAQLARSGDGNSPTAAEKSLNVAADSWNSAGLELRANGGVADAKEGDVPDKFTKFGTHLEFLFTSAPKF